MKSSTFINATFGISLVITMFFLAYHNDDRQDIAVYETVKTNLDVQLRLGGQETEGPVLESLDYIWKAPENWVPGEESRMRLATYEITLPDEGGRCEVVLSRWGGNLGGLAANVNRWREQLGLKALAEEAANESVTKQKGAFGEFLSLKLLNKDIKKGMLVASYFSEGEVVFVKLSSSAGHVEKLEKEFLAFCATVAVKE
jgi:hypothetical protein